MDVTQDREDLMDGVESELKTHKPELHFSPLDLLDGQSDTFEDALETFRYLFARKGKYLDFLWNELWWCLQTDEAVDVERLNKDEKDFILGIIDRKRQLLERYGERYGRGFNCNSPIETTRLLLRPCGPEYDREYLAFLRNNPDIFEDYYHYSYSEGAVLGASQAHKPLSFAVIERQSGSVVGVVALNLCRAGVVYNLEYIIFPDHRRKGFASEAVAALIDAAKNRSLFLPQETIREGIFTTRVADIKCVEVVARVGNAPSAALARKMGFKLNGLQPYYADSFRGEYSDAEIYDLLIS